MEANDFPFARQPERRVCDTFDGKVTHSDTGETVDIFDDVFELVEELDLAGLYEHYKSSPADRRTYVAHCAVRHRDTEECLVIYEPLYTARREMYARPIRDFTGHVEIEGTRVPRFSYIQAI